MFSVNELAAASGVSRRSIYSYVERRIIPPAVRQGRRQVYSEDHLAVLRAIRLLGRMGVPMWQIERLVTTREPDAVRGLVRPVEAIASQLDEAEQRVAEIRAKLGPTSDQLDLADLGLDDPIWLRRELVRAEREVRHLTASLQEAGQTVLPRIAGGDGPPDRSATTEADRQERRLKRLEGLVEDLTTAVTAERAEDARRAFRAGLVAARQAGWAPGPATRPPTDLPRDEAAIFEDYVAQFVDVALVEGTVR
jgi:DNA-binding transcriptional MerR regulator